jgi:hypothetical protein
MPRAGKAAGGAVSGLKRTSRSAAARALLPHSNSAGCDRLGIGVDTRLTNLCVFLVLPSDHIHMGRSLRARYAAFVGSTGRFLGVEKNGEVL